MPHISKTVTILNKYGFHVRPSTAFTKLAMTFSSTVSVNTGENNGGVDGKNIMMLMTLGVSCGQEITITCDGDDCNEALTALVSLVESSFDGIE